MLFKPFRIHRSGANVSIEFSWIMTAEEHFGRLTELLEMFGMRYGQMVCTCFYDKYVIDLNSGGNGIEINVITGKKHLMDRHGELEVAVDSDKTLKDLLNISNTYDVMLTIAPKKNSKTEMIINDNGDDYINFDNGEFDTKTMKAEIMKMVKSSKQLKV